jgi:hypothetical protein
MVNEKGKGGHKPCEIFISHKSADVALAKELYHYLKGLGFEVFESDETLPKLGSSDYRDAIDQALDECLHMIVVGSSVENITASWVKAEWGLYINEKRSGRKHGNILTVITEDLKIEDLPASLRYYEVVPYSKSNFSRIAKYMGVVDQRFAEKKNIFHKIKGNRKLVPLLSVVLICISIAYFVYQKSQPFNATIILRPAQEVSNNINYPKFDGGELSIFPDNKVETKQVFSNQEIVFQQIPSSMLGTKIAAKLNSDFWKLSSDTFELTKEINLFIEPNGKLAQVFGNIKDMKGNAIQNCKIVIDNDTCAITNSIGVFKIQLPVKMQKLKYLLTVTKEGYQPQRLDYFAGSGNIDILLAK